MNLSSAGQSITDKSVPKSGIQAPSVGKVLTINVSSAVIDPEAEWLEFQVDGETVGWFVVRR